MKRDTPRAGRDPRQRAMSDRHLSARIYDRDIHAFSCVYDRYATLVFTLLCNALPVAAETLLEDVFLNLWRSGTTAPLTDIVSMLVRLTGEAVMHYPAQHSSRLNAASTQPVLPALDPFTALPKDIGEVLMLTCLGKLTVAELSIALERDESAIRQLLAKGLSVARAQQPEVLLERAVNG